MSQIPSFVPFSLAFICLISPPSTPSSVPSSFAPSINQSSNHPTIQSKLETVHLAIRLDSSGLAESPPPPLPPVPPFPLVSATTTECHGTAMGGLPVSQPKEGVNDNIAQLSAICKPKSSHLCSFHHLARQLIRCIPSLSIANIYCNFCPNVGENQWVTNLFFPGMPHVKTVYLI